MPPTPATPDAVTADLAPKTVKKGDTVIVQTPWKKPLMAEVIALGKDGKTADLRVDGMPPAYEPAYDAKGKEILPGKELPHNLRASPRDDAGAMPDSWRPL